MNENRFAFGTDFHGNLDNVDRFLEEAAARQSDYVIFGGDIAPKKMAINTADDQALLLEFNGYQGSKFHPIGTADVAFRQGYILMPDQMEADAFLKGFEMVAKLRTLVASDEDDPRNSPWELQDFQTLETIIKPLFIDFIINHHKGKSLFKQMKQSYKLYRKPDLTPEEFWTQFLNYQKIQYLNKQNINLYGRETALLFGFKEPLTRKQLEHVIDYTLTTCAEYKTILNGFSNGCDFVTKWPEKSRNLHLHSLEGQQRSVSELVRKIARFREQTHARVISILGNDDHPELAEQFMDADNKGILVYAGNRVIPVDANLQVLGYSNVLPLPFMYDQWYKTEKEITKDLKQLKMQLRQDLRHTVFNIHMPPAGLGLSLAKIDSPDISDWGSQAVKRFIEDTRPTHVFSGHMHKSWFISGKTQAKLGDIHVFNPGDSQDTPRLIFGSLNNPEQTDLVTG